VALPKKLRLVKDSDFAKFRKPIRVFRDNAIVLKIAEGKKTGRRFAVSLPRKAGNAVSRNRIRRVLLEWIRNHLESFPEGFDFLVIIAGSNRNGKPDSVDLRDRLERLAGKALDDLEKA